MSEVFWLNSKYGSAAENRKAFIAKCRNELTVFGADLDWGADFWPNVAGFTKLGVRTRNPTSDQIMASGFVDFAKAYLRYQKGNRPNKSKYESQALRVIEAALLQVSGAANIDNLTITVLDEGAVLARQHYSSSVAYHCGREIERLATFLTENKMVSQSLCAWRSPIKRAGNETNKTGSEGQLDREKKLPDDLALNALAEIFANDPSNDRDTFTTSVFALLMSCPSSITEVLALPANCEVTEPDSDGIDRYGWRFYSGKGFEGDIKWIPTTMVPIAKEAVRRLSRLSENARSLAKWIEENPTKVYRHADCPNVDDDTPLSIEQSCMALGLAHDSKKACKSSLYNRRLSAKDGAHTLSSLWEHSLDRLPSDFPWLDEERGIRYSNALCALNRFQLSTCRGTLPFELLKPTNNLFNNDVSPREFRGKYTQKSIFDRHGYKSRTGGRLKLTSHQARHLLNTIAQRGGLAELEIAKWSGRANARENRTYNHMQEYELVSLAEQIDPTKTLFGPVGKVSKNGPVSAQEFNTMERAAAHITEFGFCVHDYTMSPCEKYRDCVNCTEQVCVKGNEENLARIKNRLKRTEPLLKRAKDAIKRGDMGADRWYQYHKKTATRLRELVSILEDRNIEGGAQIKLRGNDFSQLRRVVAKKLRKAIGDETGNLSAPEGKEKRLGDDLG